MKKCLILITLILLLNFVSADWTPQGDINLRDIYDITQGVNATFQWFNGLFNWTTNDSYTSFDGNLLSFNESKLNSSIDERSSILNVNSSDKWDDLDTINSTQMEDNSGTLNILESWLTSFINSWLSGKTTDDLTEGSTNLYDNQSWNETWADTLYWNEDENISALGYNLTIDYINGLNITTINENATLWSKYLSDYVFPTNWTHNLGIGFNDSSIIDIANDSISVNLSHGNATFWTKYGDYIQISSGTSVYGPETLPVIRGTALAGGVNVFGMDNGLYLLGVNQDPSLSFYSDPQYLTNVSTITNILSEGGVLEYDSNIKHRFMDNVEIYGNKNITFNNTAETQTGFVWNDYQTPTENASILFDAATNNDLIFNVMGQNVMMLKENGFIGINTINPQQALDVVGGINGSKNLTIKNTAGAGIIRGEGTAGAKLQLGNSIGTGNLRNYQFDSRNDRIDLARMNDAWGSTLDSIMTWDNTGYVGINTTSPQNTLNVVGDLNVTGNYINGANTGLTGNYSRGECWDYISGGIITDTNCTAL
ncbi:MAG: hypothetical protein ACFFG0_03095 [Candidatus Thorarchaeota archaeon]